jgi:hypothetical protein
MLLRKVTELPMGAHWRYEVKWDGYRMQALKHDGKMRLLSRNGADYTRRFAQVAEAISRVKPRTPTKVCSYKFRFRKVCVWRIPKQPAQGPGVAR